MPAPNNPQPVRYHFYFGDCRSFICNRIPSSCLETPIGIPQHQLGSLPPSPKPGGTFLSRNYYLITYPQPPTQNPESLREQAPRPIDRRDCAPFDPGEHKRNVCVLSSSTSRREIPLTLPSLCKFEHVSAYPRPLVPRSHSYLVCFHALLYNFFFFFFSLPFFK